MNPRKLGSLTDGGLEPWKLPLPEFIVECYRKSFGRSEPEHVRSLEEVVQAEERRRKEKQARKAEKMVIPAGSAQSTVPVDGLASASRRPIRSRTLALARNTRTIAVSREPRIQFDLWRLLPSHVRGRGGYERS
jgi:hypothetical protein